MKCSFNFYFIFVLGIILRLLLTCALIHTEETLPEGHVERVDRLRFSTTLLQVPNCFSSTGPTTAALLVIAFYSVQPLEVSHYVDSVFRQQGFLGEIFRLWRLLSIHVKQLKEYQVVTTRSSSFLLIVNWNDQPFCNNLTRQDAYNFIRDVYALSCNSLSWCWPECGPVFRIDGTTSRWTVWPISTRRRRQTRDRSAQVVGTPSRCAPEKSRV